MAAATHTVAARPPTKTHTAMDDPKRLQIPPKSSDPPSRETPMAAAVTASPLARTSAGITALAIAISTPDVAA